MWGIAPKYEVTVNSKTENRTTFKFRGKLVTHVKSNWHSNFERGRHIVSSHAKVLARRRASCMSVAGKDQQMLPKTRSSTEIYRSCCCYL